MSGHREIGFLSFDPENALIRDELLGVRSALYGAELYASIFKRLHEIFQSGAAMILYESGKEVGKRYGTIVKEKFGENLSKASDVLVEHARLTGWGIFESPVTNVAKWLLLKRVTVIIKKNFHAEAVGQTGQPSCHFLRGLLEGFTSVLTRAECRCEELACMSSGNKFCKFEIHLRPQT